jgi:hypothetical protein
MADRVELVYGDDRTGVKRASIRSNQCSTAFLKAFFQVGNFHKCVRVVGCMDKGKNRGAAARIRLKAL